jgi:enamine deaminase RidA (YjgF/YER057c/UK114 family)
MAILTRKSPAKVHKPFANYSHVVTAQGANKLVFCAGQVAADPTGKVLPPDNFAAQTKMVMENLLHALAEGGASLKDVTKVTIYICNPHDVPKARSILQDYFGDNPPASALCVARAGESELPVGDRSNRRGVSISAYFTPPSSTTACSPALRLRRATEA